MIKLLFDRWLDQLRLMLRNTLWIVNPLIIYFSIVFTMVLQLLRCIYANLYRERSTADTVSSVWQGEAHLTLYNNGCYTQDRRNVI
jgi:hypothetical protein